MKDNTLIVISPAYPPPLIGGSKVWTFDMVENSNYSNCEILTSKLKEGYSEIINPNHKVFRSSYIWDSNSSNPSTKELIASYLYIIYWVIKRSRKKELTSVLFYCFF